MIHKNLGSIPAAGSLLDADHALLATTEGGFRSVGDLLATHRQKQAVDTSQAAAFNQRSRRWPLLNYRHLLPMRFLWSPCCLRSPPRY